MLDMDRDMLDGLKTTRCWRWTLGTPPPRVASELDCNFSIFDQVGGEMYFYILDLLAQCSKAKTSGCS